MNLIFERSEDDWLPDPKDIPWRFGLRPLEPDEIIQNGDVWLDLLDFMPAHKSIGFFAIQWLKDSRRDKWYGGLSDELIYGVVMESPSEERIDAYENYGWV